VTAVDTNTPTTSSGMPDTGKAIAKQIDSLIALALLPPALSRAVRAQFEEGGRKRQGPWTLFGLLVLYAFESGGGCAPEHAAPAAAAVEFAAAAGSVLDDLQDLDPVAEIDSDRPGAGAELIALLMTLSQRAMASLEHGPIPPGRVLAAHGILSRFELRGLAGQHNSIEQSGRTDVTLEESATASCAKSGSFGRMAAEIGAPLATDDGECIARHGRFGWHVAVVDQMQNDVAGVWPDGQPSSDIALGRVTPPVAFALQVPEGASKAADEVKSAFADTGSPPDEARIREALFRSGGVHYAWILAAVHMSRARRIAEEEVRRSRCSRLADLLRV